MTKKVLDLTSPMLTAMIDAGKISKIAVLTVDDGFIVVAEHPDFYISNRLHTARGQARLFKTRDASIKAIQGAGWTGGITFL